MRKSRKKIIPIRSTRVTATISVMLVLVILGVVALLAILAGSVSRDIKQQLGFVTIMSDTTSPDDLRIFEARLKTTPGVKQVSFSSADDVMKRWLEISGEEEDAEEILMGVNPFFSEFEVSVTEAYSHPDSLSKIIAPFETDPIVSEVVVHTDIARSVNETIRSMTLLLLAIAVGLLVIAFILINNTVRLTVYSKRFLIHTMKLVGATGAFIRRPILRGNFIQGAISAICAIGFLAGALAYLERAVDPEIMRAITWPMAAAVFVCIFILGTLICVLAALLSANKYLRTDYDDMF